MEWGWQAGKTAPQGLAVVIAASETFEQLRGRLPLAWQPPPPGPRYRASDLAERLLGAQ